MIQSYIHIPVFKEYLQMESILAKLSADIHASLTKFLSKKLDGVVDEDVIDSWIDEWKKSDCVMNIKTKVKKDKSIKEENDDNLSKVVTVDVFDRESLSKLSNADLKELCKKRNLTCSGTKAKLVDKLLDVNSQKLNIVDEPEKKTKTVEKKTKPKVIEKIEKEFQLEIDEFGNLYHEETGFVFKKIRDENHVIGRLDKDRKIVNLNDDDVDECKSLNLRYVYIFDEDDDMYDD